MTEPEHPVSPADGPGGDPAGSRTVREVLRDHAILLDEADALDRTVFGEVVTEEILFVDGRIDCTLTNAAGVSYTCPAHLVALIDTVEKRLVWPWQAPEGVISRHTALPEHVRDEAREAGPAELATGPHPFGGEWSPRQLVEAARALAGVYPLRLRRHTPDDRWHAAFVLDTPYTRLPAPTVESVRATLTDGLDREIRDTTHREMVLGYGRTRPGLSAAEDGRDVLLRPSSGGEVRVRCDDAGEVIGLGGGLTLDDVLDDAVFLSAEHQLHLEDLTGSRVRISYDLEAGTLSIEPYEPDRTPLIGCTAHQLGTQSTETDDWLWAWSRQERHDGYERAAGLREFGRTHAIGPLVHRRVANSGRANGWVFEVAAKPVLGAWTSVTVATTTDGSVRAFFLVDHPALRLGAPSSWAFGRATTFAESNGRPMPRDTRRALESYSRLRGVPLHWADAERTRCELDFGGGDVAHVELDERGFLRHVRGSLGPGS